MIAFHGLEFGLAGLALVAATLWAFVAPWRKPTTVVRFSALTDLKEATRGQHPRAESILKGLRLVAIVLLVLALFRPRAGETVEEILNPGVDIVLVLDLSDTMRSEDMGGRMRVEAAKDVIARFVRGRTHDRIGLVVFAEKAYTQCPLTTDYGLLERLVSQLDVGTIKADATAIGNGLAIAVNRLKDSPARSKVIVLLTDGQNNAGSIDPDTAAELAKSLAIKIYTVGVASKGPARIKVRDPFGRWVYTTSQADLNEESLTAIALKTGGLFRRATDDKALVEIFEEISRLEKTPVKVREYHLYHELFLYLVIPALIFLFVEFVLASTLFRRIP